MSRKKVSFTLTIPDSVLPYYTKFISMDGSGIVAWKNKPSITKRPDNYSLYEASGVFKEILIFENNGEKNLIRPRMIELSSKEEK